MKLLIISLIALCVIFGAILLAAYTSLSKKGIVIGVLVIEITLYIIAIITLLNGNF